MSQPTPERIVSDICRVAVKLRKGPGEVFTRSEYLNGGARFSYDQLYSVGDGWTLLCRTAGFKTKEKESISDDAYFARLVTAVDTLGRFPKVYERTRYGLSFSKSRWSTLQLFLDDAVARGIVPEMRIKRLEVAGTVSVMPVASIQHDLEAAVPKNNSTRITPPIPARTKRKKWKRTGLPGFPYAPHDESGVVALFAILCANGTLDWEILSINCGKGIDATCFDHGQNREIRVDLKHLLTRGGWNHRIDDVDFVVCWENRWKDFPLPVLELRKLIQQRE